MAYRFNSPTPYQNIKQRRIKRTDVDPLSLDEVKSILATVREDFRDYFTVRFFTGMRTGEVDGLKWMYVDFERRLILVRGCAGTASGIPRPPHNSRPRNNSFAVKSRRCCDPARLPLHGMPEP